MQARLTHVLMGLGVCAGLMMGTGHVGGGLAVAVSAAALAWLGRVEAPRGEPR